MAKARLPAPGLDHYVAPAQLRRIDQMISTSGQRIQVFVGLKLDDAKVGGHTATFVGCLPARLAESAAVGVD